MKLSDYLLETLERNGVTRIFGNPGTTEIPGEDRHLSLRDPLNILFKRRDLILVFFLVVVLTVSIGSFLITPKYEAKAQVLVRIGRDNILVSSMGEHSPNIYLEQEQHINSEIEILKSNVLAETVIRKLGGPEAIYPNLKPRDGENTPRPLLKRLWPFAVKEPTMSELQEKEMYDALEMFKKSLTIEGIKKSNAIYIYGKPPSRARQATSSQSAGSARPRLAARCATPLAATLT